MGTRPEVALRGQPYPAASTAARRLAIKRALDFAAATGLLVLLSPLMLTLAVVIKLETAGAPIYVDRRRGLHGRVFPMFKFRTMHRGAASERPHLLAASSADPPLFKLRNDHRVTPVGRLLRRWSLDELPQLLNVIAGHMSLIGPRPLIVQEADALGDHGIRRTAMRPGISGPWQVAGRSELTTEALIHLDTSYIDNWTLRRDLHLLARTLPAVLSSKGSY